MGPAINSAEPGRSGDCGVVAVSEAENQHGCLQLHDRCIVCSIEHVFYSWWLTRYSPMVIILRLYIKFWCGCAMPHKPLHTSGAENRGGSHPFLIIPMVKYCPEAFCLSFYFIPRIPARGDTFPEEQLINFLPSYPCGRGWVDGAMLGVGEY